MSTAHVLLGLLARGDARHGYELKREHDARLPRIRPLAYGQVYATISRLVRDGLISEAGHDSEAGPERTSYRLTDRGRATLREWLGTVEKPAPHITDALYTKVVVALLAGPDDEWARGYLAAQRAAHTARMRELTAAKSAPGAELPDVVSADYLVAHLDADLTWMRTTLSRLAALRATLTEG